MAIRTIRLRIDDQLAALFTKRYGWPDEAKPGENRVQFFRRIFKQHIVEAAKVQLRQDRLTAFNNTANEDINAYLIEMTEVQP